MVEVLIHLQTKEIEILENNREIGLITPEHAQHKRTMLELDAMLGQGPTQATGRLTKDILKVNITAVYRHVQNINGGRINEK